MEIMKRDYNSDKNKIDEVILRSNSTKQRNVKNMVIIMIVITFTITVIKMIMYSYTHNNDYINNKYHITIQKS